VQVLTSTPVADISALSRCGELYLEGCFKIRDFSAIANQSVVDLSGLPINDAVVVGAALLLRLISPLHSCLYHCGDHLWFVLQSDNHSLESEAETGLPSARLHVSQGWRPSNHEHFIKTRGCGSDRPVNFVCRHASPEHGKLCL
jgi:hypothetical protein